MSRVALVTGAGGGIGAAVARRLAGQGVFVAVVDRDGDAAARTAASLPAPTGADAGGEPAAEAHALDVTDGAAVEVLCADLADRFGGLHAAVNCAGVTGVRAPLADYPPRVFERVMEVNAGGVFHCMRAELRAMTRGDAGGASGASATGGSEARAAAARGGAIVNVASGSAWLGAPGASAYTASKHAVAGLTRAAAVEYADRGIRINAVAPGLVLTDAVDLDADRFAAAHPIGRPADPDEIAAAICWLLSPESAYLTGAVIPIDGGLTAQVAGLR